jgi:hypothetical protein
MKLWLSLLLIFQAIVVGLFVAAVQTRRIPLGIPGQWEWGRVRADAQIGWLMIAACSIIGYAAFVAVGYRSLQNGGTRWSRPAWLAALTGAALTIQVAIPSGAADEYDLTKWAYVNYFAGSTGYFKVAREQALVDPWSFLARYPEWIQKQDSLHIGTHPPGLIAVQCLLIGVMDRSPKLADFLLGHTPASVEAGFRQLIMTDRPPLRRAEQAALYLTALITLAACAGTVMPLYALARVALPTQVAWSAAALWPLVPAANLFQPVADTTYPMLSTTAWALAAWSARAAESEGRLPRRTFVLAFVSGSVMAFGLFFTLAFLPVGLVVAFLVGTNRLIRLRSRAVILVTIGLGCMLLIAAGWIGTGANPITVWSWNLHHHARFYDEYPRTYWQWLWVNPIELAVAIGLPIVCWAIVGFCRPRSLPRSVWCLFGVLVVVNLTGRNMGEVARLWLLFTPPFLIAAAYGLSECRGRSISVGITAAIVGLQTLAMQTMIQVVYPV